MVWIAASRLLCKFFTLSRFNYTSRCVCPGVSLSPSVSGAPHLWQLVIKAFDAQIAQCCFDKEPPPFRLCLQTWWRAGGVKTIVRLPDFPTASRRWWLCHRCWSVLRLLCCKKALTGKIKTFDGSWSSRPSRGWGQTQAAQLLLMQKDGGGPLAHRRYDGSTRVNKGGDRLLNAQLHRGVICHTCHNSHLHICVCSRGSKLPHRKTPYCKRHVCTREDAGKCGARRHVCVNVIGGSGGYSWLGAATPSTRPTTWTDPFSIN